MLRSILPPPPPHVSSLLPQSSQIMPFSPFQFGINFWNYKLLEHSVGVRQQDMVRRKAPTRMKYHIYNPSGTWSQDPSVRALRNNLLHSQFQIPDMYKWHCTSIWGGMEVLEMEPQGLTVGRVPVVLEDVCLSTSLLSAGERRVVVRPNWTATINFIFPQLVSSSQQSEIRTLKMIKH